MHNKYLIRNSFSYNPKNILFSFLLFVFVLYFYSCKKDSNNIVIDENLKYSLFNKYIKEKVDSISNESNILSNIIRDTNNLSSIEIKKCSFKFGVPDTNKPLFHKLIEYNESGFPISNKYYENLEYLSIKYIYNKDNKLSEEIHDVYKKGVKLFSFTVNFEYDSLGLLRKYEKFVDLDLYPSDNTSKNQKKISLWARDAIEKYNKEKYFTNKYEKEKYFTEMYELYQDKHRRLVSTKYRFPFRQVQFHYNSNNNITNIICFSNTGFISQKSVYDYKNNNEIKSFNKYHYKDYMNDIPVHIYSIMLNNDNKIIEKDSILNNNFNIEIINGNTITVINNNTNDTLFEYSYDKYLNITKLTDKAKNITYEYEYDNNSKITTEMERILTSNTVSKQTIYIYNPDGLISEKSVLNNLKENILKVKYEYQNNLLTSITEYNGLNDPQSITIYSYKYFNE